VSYYPYVKGFLEKTGADGDDQLCVIATMAIEKYFTVPEPEPEQEPVNSLSSDMQDLHKRIVADSWLCDHAKLILLLTTFIPPGRYNSHPTIRDWVAVLPYCHNLDTYTVYKALRNDTQFSLSTRHMHIAL
jgi:hypothetical protein